MIAKMSILKDSSFYVVYHNPWAKIEKNFLYIEFFNRNMILEKRINLTEYKGVKQLLLTRCEENENYIYILAYSHFESTYDLFSVNKENGELSLVKKISAIYDTNKTRCDLTKQDNNILLTHQVSLADSVQLSCYSLTTNNEIKDSIQIKLPLNLKEATHYLVGVSGDNYHFLTVINYTPDSTKGTHFKEVIKNKSFQFLFTEFRKNENRISHIGENLTNMSAAFYSFQYLSSTQRLIVGGYTTSKFKTNEAEGTFLINYDFGSGKTTSVSSNTFSEETLKQMNSLGGIGRKQPLINMYVNYLTVMDNNRIIICGEKMNYSYTLYTQFHSSGRRGHLDSYSNYYFGNVLATCYDQNGELLWSKPIQKCQSIMGSHQGFSYFLLKKNNNIHLIFNDHKKNKEICSSDFKWVTKAKKSSIAIVTISENGDMSKQIVMKSKCKGKTFMDPSEKWPILTGERGLIYYSKGGKKRFAWVTFGF
jgi:hypothetical protein